MFKCANCKKEITEDKYIGTRFRNHCPKCLWSKHIGQESKVSCRGKMKPIGLTFKKEGGGKLGELMIIHVCQKCGSISINRLAADDNEKGILALFEKSKDLKDNWDHPDITPLGEEDRTELMIQLFGKNNF